MERTSQTIRLTALWDAEARVWSASSTDMPGLITEGNTLEELAENILTVFVELEACMGKEPRETSFEVECVREERSTPLCDLSMHRAPHQLAAG